MGRRLSLLVASDVRMRLAAGLLALATVMVVVGLSLSTESSAPSSDVTPSPTPSLSQPRLQSVAAPPSLTPHPPAAAPAGVEDHTDALVVPSLDLTAPIIPIEMNKQGVLTPPADVDTVGWWQRSAEPGADQGQTLITGHSVRLGDGAMDRIGELDPGDRVRVRSDGRTVTYRATEVVVYSRAEVAAKAQELFGQDRRDGRLVLVTCTDWDGDTYRRNIIVFAEPVAA